MIRRTCSFLRSLRRRHFATNAGEAKLLVTCEDLGRIRLLGINRPEKKNAINAATAEQLQSAFEKFDADDSVDVAVLFGHGGSFCAGYDLEELSHSGHNLIESLKGKGPLGLTRMLTSKPTVAAVQGYAVAGGFELALWCDLRVIEETAIMGVFCRRFGVPLINGGTARLPQLIGMSRALEIIMTGRPVDSKEASQLGLAARLVSCGSGVGQAVSLAQQIAKFPQECLKADKRSVYHATFDAATLEQALDFELANGSAVVAVEGVTGAKRFVEGVGRHGSFNMYKVHSED